jgi:hypothetical protein
MAARKAPRRIEGKQPSAESHNSVESPVDGEATTTLVPTTPPAGSEDVAVTAKSEAIQRMQALADIAGRIFRALTLSLKSEQKTLQVLGAITWLVLLAVPVSLVVVLIVLVFQWEPLHTILLLAGSTGLVASANLVSRHLRKGK